MHASSPSRLPSPPPTHTKHTHTNHTHSPRPHLHQLLLVRRLQLLPGRRQERATGVIHQIQRQPAARLPVAGRIQQLQPRDAPVKHARAALRVDVALAVARQARDDAHAVGGQEFRQVLLAGLQEDRQVAAVDDGEGRGVGPQRARATDEAPAGAGGRGWGVNASAALSCVMPYRPQGAAAASI